MTLHAEPTVAPSRINATALTAFEMQVSWDPVQHLSANGILRGYEVKDLHNIHINIYIYHEIYHTIYPPTCAFTPNNVTCNGPWSKVVHYKGNSMQFGMHI